MDKSKINDSNAIVKKALDKNEVPGKIESSTKQDKVTQKDCNEVDDRWTKIATLTYLNCPHN